MKKKLTLLAAIFVVMIACSMTAFASTAFTATNYKDGLGVELTPDKMEYEAGTTANLSVEVTNYNDYAVNNVKIQSVLPDGLRPADSDAEKSIGSLAAGQSLSLGLKVVKTKVEPAGSYAPSSNPSISSLPSASQSAVASLPAVTSQVSNPSTGGGKYTATAVVSVLSVLAVIFLLYLIRKKRKKGMLKKGISMLLVVAMLAPLAASLRAAAETAPGSSFNVSQTVMFDGSSYNLAATVTYDASSTAAGDSASYTRGQWVDLLLKKLGYDTDTVASHNSTESNYYGDSGSSEYGKEIEFAHGLGILPPPDNGGYVDPEQDVPLFEPDKKVTREFAAYTAITALGFTGDVTDSDSLSCKDADALTYPKQDALAIRQGFLSLQDGSFAPARDLTASEKASVFAAIDYINASAQVDTDKTAEYIKYAPNVVVDPLKAVTDYTLTDNSDGTYTVMLPTDNATHALAAGTVFVLPANTANPTGSAFKVSKVQQNDVSSVTLICTVPDDSDVLEQMQYSGATVVAADEIQAAPGVTVAYDKDGTIDMGDVVRNGISVSSNVVSEVSAPVDSTEAVSPGLITRAYAFDETNPSSDKKTEGDVAPISPQKSSGFQETPDSSAETTKSRIAPASRSVKAATLTAQQSTAADTGTQVSIPGNLSVEFEQKIDDDMTVSGSLEMSMPVITCKADIDFNPFASNHVKDLLLTMQQEATVTGKLTFASASHQFKTTDFSSNPAKKDGQIELFTSPSVLIADTGLTLRLVVYAKFTAQGTVSLSYKTEMTNGIEVQNGAVRLVHDASNHLDDMELKGSMKLGPTADIQLTFLNVVNLAGLDINAGVAADATFIEHTDVTPAIYCADGVIYLYGSMDLDDNSLVGMALKVVNESWSWEFWTADNSPLKWQVHIENGHLVSQCTYGQGKISGVVEDAERLTPLVGARVVLYEGDTPFKTIYTEFNGKYDISDLPAGSYTLKISATGRYTFTSTVDVTNSTTTYVETLLMVSRGDASSGAVSGRVIDAVTGASVPNVGYTVWKGWNNTSSNQVSSGTSADGNYAVSLPAGNYTVQFSKDGYTSNSVNVAIVAATQAEKDVTLSPSMIIPTNGTIRIVLTWGEIPSDLDSHLFGPTIDGSAQFHTCYYGKDYDDGTTQIANLDLDDTSSYGPETTTIYQADASGTYQFFVHDFSNRWSANSTALAQSGAQVKVYADNVQVAVYNVPTDKAGTLWHVFNYDAAAHRLTPVNTFSDNSAPTFDNIGNS